MRRKLVGFLLVLCTIGLGIVWLLREAPPRARGGLIERSASEAPPAFSAGVGTPAQRPAAGVMQQRARARAERDALRERIVRALDDQAHGVGSAAAAAAGAASARRPPGPPAELGNHLGERRQPLVDYLNQDFMPLATECIDQATERKPALRGMLGLSIEIVADEQLGGVIDRAEPTPRNEVADEELLECLRQTALTVTLPAPLITGREQFQITLRVGSNADGGD